MYVRYICIMLFNDTAHETVDEANVKTRYNFPKSDSWKGSISSLFVSIYEPQSTWYTDTCSHWVSRTSDLVHAIFITTGQSSNASCLMDTTQLRWSDPGYLCLPSFTLSSHLWLIRLLLIALLLFSVSFTSWPKFPNWGMEMSNFIRHIHMVSRC